MIICVGSSKNWNGDSYDDSMTEKAWKAKNIVKLGYIIT